MKFSMAMATLVAANAVAAYEVPNDNTIAKLAAGYEGKKPGSGSVRGSVQEFAADVDVAASACFAAGKKYGFCVSEKASSAGHEKEVVEWGECVKKVETMQEWEACDAAQPALAPYRKKCENELENVKKACGITSSFMTLMGSVEVFGALPFEQDEEYEAFYGTYSASEAEDEDESWDEDAVQEFATDKKAACEADFKAAAANCGKCAKTKGFVKEYEAVWKCYDEALAKASKCVDGASSQDEKLACVEDLANGLEACNAKVAPLETACSKEFDQVEKAIETCIAAGMEAGMKSPSLSLMNEEDKEYEAFYGTYSASEDEDEDEFWDEEEDEEYWDM